RRPDEVAGLVLVEPMPREALRGSLRAAARLRPLVLSVARLVRALNALGVHRRRVARLDLVELDRQTRAAMSEGASETLVRRYASPWIDLRTTPTGVYLQSLMAVSRGLPDLAAIRVPVLALLSTGGARMVPFGGWEMPVQYAGIVEEHRAVRGAVGLFDVSHMGEFEVAGPHARVVLQSLTTNDVAVLAVGQVQYSVLCYPTGTIVD